MSDKSFDHVLHLRRGEEAEIELRFAREEGASVTVALASVDPASGTAELAIEDLWGGYRMQRFVEDSARWLPVWPGEDGEVRVVVRFGAGHRLSLTSDAAYIHSIELREVAWAGGALRLTFVEMG